MSKGFTRGFTPEQTAKMFARSVAHQSGKHQQTKGKQMYTVEKHRGLWWVIDAEGFEARSVGYETKKEALVSARIVEQDDKADRARKQAFVDRIVEWKPR